MPRIFDGFVLGHVHYFDHLFEDQYVATLGRRILTSRAPVFVVQSVRVSPFSELGNHLHGNLPSHFRFGACLIAEAVCGRPSVRGEWSRCLWLTGPVFPGLLQI